MQISDGTITEQQILLTDEYYLIYSKYTKRCTDALNAYAKKKIYKSLKAFENGDYELTAYFIVGSSRNGKSYFAKDLVDSLIGERKERFNELWTCYNAATRNAMDDYKGEEIVLMDDNRGSSMTAEDWLKFLDPKVPNKISARFRNVPDCKSRVIIITSTIEPLEFFFFVKQKSDVNEALDQFFARLTKVIRVQRYDDTCIDVDENQKIGIQGTGRYDSTQNISVPIKKNGSKIQMNAQPYHPRA
jgi:adenosyl cobinamide kinase/adenosyl cobinamide phosphate guanylyltransferase